jgi:hypothetical protein
MLQRDRWSKELCLLARLGVSTLEVGVLTGLYISWVGSRLVLLT